jgi:hypothetical protein
MKQVGQYTNTSQFDTEAHSYVTKIKLRSYEG